MEITMDELPPQVSAVVSVTRDGLDDLNALCRAIEPLDTEQREKLGAAVLLAQPTYASEVRQLVESLDQALQPRRGLRDNRPGLCVLPRQPDTGSPDDG